MQWSDLPRNPSERTLRQFAALCLLFAGGVIASKLRHGDGVGLTLVASIAGAIIGVIGLAWPAAIKPVFVTWIVAAFPFGWLFSRAVILLLYVLVVTPLALMFRVIRRDPLSLRRQSAKGTYWTPKPQNPDVASYFRQY